MREFVECDVVAQLQHQHLSHDFLDAKQPDAGMLDKRL